VKFKEGFQNTNCRRRSTEKTRYSKHVPLAHLGPDRSQYTK